MNRYADIVTRLLKYALWHDNSPLDRELFGGLSDTDWGGVHELALREGVSAIVFDALTEADIAIPRPIKMRFISAVSNIENEYAAKLKTASRLAEIYRHNGIRMMILKGLGLSQLYPKPNHRPCCDIDIYLFGRQHEADEILRKTYGIAIDEDKHHHTVFYIGKTMVENHYDFIEAHSRRSKTELEQRLKSIAETERPIKIEIGRLEAYIPSPNLNALFLTLHSGAHFAAGNISIRHLIDWSLFIDRYGDKVDWEKVYALADEFGFRGYIDCLNTMCFDYLGLEQKPFITVSQETGIVERAWADTLEYGKNAIPDNFFKGWIYRIDRRFANVWKQRMVYHRDGMVSSFLLSAATHVIKPKYWRKNCGGGKSSHYRRYSNSSD